MPLHPRAGQSPTPDDLVNVPRLITAYYAEHPDVSQAPQRVSFGTSGHRGSAFDAAFNEDHILAITQAICEYRGQNGADGPLFLAADTHALSEPAFASALEVLAANDVEVMIDQDRGYTPTPALSHAILTYNRPPGQRGPHRRAGRRHRDHPFAQSARRWRLQIQSAAWRTGRHGGHQMDRRPRQPDSDATACAKCAARRFASALAASTTHRHDYISAYVNDLASVVDLDAVRAAGPSLGADPLGRSGRGVLGPDRGKATG